MYIELGWQLEFIRRVVVDLFYLKRALVLIAEAFTRTIGIKVTAVELYEVVNTDIGY